MTATEPMLDAAQDMIQQALWHEYCDHFPYSAPDLLRPGCQPRLLRGDSDRSLVLAHGLTDSPGFVLGLAEFFRRELGFTVYLPLLQCHGLREPQGMAGVSLQAWFENIDFSIRCAAAEGGPVSVGGLSTGGALALNAACSNRLVNGDIYLFAAALGLYGELAPLVGRVKENLLRGPLPRLLPFSGQLVGANPYRYQKVPLVAAAELAQLMKILEKKIPGPVAPPFGGRLFVAWSEADRVVDTKAYVKLVRALPVEQSAIHVLPDEFGVAHAELVLPESVRADNLADGPVLERANPFFGELQGALREFTGGGWGDLSPASMSSASP